MKGFSRNVQDRAELKGEPILTISWMLRYTPWIHDVFLFFGGIRVCYQHYEETDG